MKGVRKKIVIIAGALAILVIALIVVFRDSDKTITDKLTKAQQIYMSQEYPRRAEHFLDLALACERYFSRFKSLADRENLVKWLGNPDDQWDDTEKKDMTELVYFYEFQGDNKRAMMATMNKTTNHITEIIPAYFQNDPRKH